MAHRLRQIQRRAALNPSGLYTMMAVPMASQPSSSSDATPQEVLALRTAEARWRAVIDSAVDAIIVIDQRGAIEVFNPAAERMFGYREADVLGRNVTLLMPAPYRDEHDGYMSHYLETGEQRIIGVGREVRATRRDGTTFPVHLSVGEARIGDRRHFTGILHDLSARTALEARLTEQTALARLGEMAAVIAHEVKNPLTAVRGAIQVIGGRLPPGNRDAPIVKEILARLDGLNGLIQDLLRFARPPEPRLGKAELKPLLEITADLLRKDPSFAELEIDITGPPAPVAADAELLKIVFQNLMINAAQAMHGRGRVQVAISTAGGRHRVRVEDHGPGIAAEVREKLFQPFVTTKARGTGLGLSIARRLVEAHGGTIAVECPPEGGTRVSVDLPEDSASGSQAAGDTR
jgi:two-component system sensor kinase FixL